MSTGILPPAGLTPRVAEVTVALIEAWNTSPPGWYPSIAEIHLYDSARVTTDETMHALREAAGQGLAEDVWPGWQPTGKAQQLHRRLEEWFYTATWPAEPLPATAGEVER